MDKKCIFPIVSTGANTEINMFSKNIFSGRKMQSPIYLHLNTQNDILTFPIRSTQKVLITLAWTRMYVPLYALPIFWSYARNSKFVWVSLLRRWLRSTRTILRTASNKKQKNSLFKASFSAFIVLNLSESHPYPIWKAQERAPSCRLW